MFGHKNPAPLAVERMPELADALAEAGCSNPDILSHCRGPEPHVRGCWVVDLVLEIVEILKFHSVTRTWLVDRGPHEALFCDCVLVTNQPSHSGSTF